MQTFLKGKRVGYWLSEKKVKKLNFQAFAELCRKRGIEVVQLNLSRPIEEQGPLDVIIHKLTDVILEADQNDSQSLELVHRFQEYIDAHPETIVLDPLPAIRTLLDRSKSYELIRKIEAYMKDDRICSPPFMELTSLCGDDTMRLLEQNGLAFPFICKTRVAHGTNSHEVSGRLTYLHIIPLFSHCSLWPLLSSVARVIPAAVAGSNTLGCLPRHSTSCPYS